MTNLTGKFVSTILINYFYIRYYFIIKYFLIFLFLPFLDRYENEGVHTSGLDPYQFIKDMEISSQNIENKAINNNASSRNNNNSFNKSSIDTEEISKILKQHGLITDLREYQLQGILWMYNRLSLSHSNNGVNSYSDAVNGDIYGIPTGWVPLKLKSMPNNTSSSDTDSIREYLYWYHSVTGEISFNKPISMQLPNGGDFYQIFLYYLLICLFSNYLI